MNSPINVLIVDDHPFIIEAYKNAIKGYNSKGAYEFIITQAKDCKTGYEAITEAAEPFGIAFFDLSMPTYEEKGIFSGEDLAKLIKQQTKKLTTNSSKYNKNLNKISSSKSYNISKLIIS